jgi:hypothetical protein
MIGRLRAGEINLHAFLPYFSPPTNQQLIPLVLPHTIEHSQVIGLLLNCPRKVSRCCVYSRPVTYLFTDSTLFFLLCYLYDHFLNGHLFAHWIR